MDGRHACHANILYKVMNNRLHDYRHGKSNMLTAVKDVWLPQFNLIIAVVAENCRECIAKDNSFGPVCTKGDLYKFAEPREPNESLQLGFWWPNSFLNESKKAKRFSFWPSATFCKTNNSDETPKFLKSYMTNRGCAKEISRASWS